MCVISAIEFNELWKYFLQMNEHGSSKIFHIIPWKIQFGNPIFILNSAQFLHLHNSIEFKAKFLQVLKLFNPLQRCKMAIVKHNRSDRPVLQRQLINNQRLISIWKCKNLAIPVEVGLVAIDVFRKHNEYFNNNSSVNIMDKDNFISLCDLHNSIIHEYGCDISCQRQAGVCIRGCS